MRVFVCWVQDCTCVGLCSGSEHRGSRVLFAWRKLVAGTHKHNLVLVSAKVLHWEGSGLTGGLQDHASTCCSG